MQPWLSWNWLLQTRVTLNSQKSTCLCIPSAGITLCATHTQLLQIFSQSGVLVHVHMCGDQMLTGVFLTLPSLHLLRQHFLLSLQLPINCCPYFGQPVFLVHSPISPSSIVLSMLTSHPDFYVAARNLNSYLCASITSTVSTKPHFQFHKCYFQTFFLFYVYVCGSELRMNTVCMQVPEEVRREH